MVFGGTFLDDTWEFDGTDWAQRTVTGPPYRSTTMAYDPVRHQAVIYGGEGDEIYGDTWAWSGTEWAQVDQGGSGPPLMDEMAMAFDSARGKLVMFGGRDDLNYDLNDQWEWNGSQWRSVAPHGAAWPTERSGASLVFDSARGCLVMFGGGVFTASASTFLAETWEYCPPP